MPLSRFLASALTLSALSVMACGGSELSDPLTQPGGSDGKGDGPAVRCGDCGSVPVAPETEDERYVIGEHDPWMLIGDGLTQDESLLTLQVEAVPGTEIVAWLGAEAYLFAERDGELTVELDVADFPPGSYEILLAERGAETAFGKRSFTRSFPLYVVTSIDWDGPNPPDTNLERQERLHDRHPHLLLTHLVGPYTFTAPLEPARVDEITYWLNGMRDAYGDEIGLHIHPYCHFLEDAGMDCRLEPAFYEVEQARAGYTVFLHSYEEEQARRMFAHAKQLFEANGLGTPTSFRAGAWSAQAHTLRALDAEGFVADSSAVAWKYLEEWENNGSPLFEFLRENWAPMDEYSQPYYPAHDDHLATSLDHLDLLQIPDNGALVDYIRADEMIDVVDANLGDGVLERPKVVSIGYHVDNFSEAYFERMDGALTHIDTLLDASDAGPVVYTRMSDLAVIDWTAFSRD